MQKKSLSSVKIFYPRFSQESLVKTLRERIVNLPDLGKIKKIILFGSWANGNYTAFSDIDILAIYADDYRDDLFSILKRRLRIPGIEPHIYSEQEYRSLKGSIDRMIEHGVVIYP